MQELQSQTLSGLPIRFDRVMVVVGGGTVDGAVLKALADRGAALVGADSGGDTIRAAGLVPDAIIGDLDSISARDGWSAATRMLHIPEQITTDFQKVLYSTEAPVTVALGMTGKRFDHTLAALSAVTENATRKKVILVDEHDIALAVAGDIRFAVDAGERVSVHPLLPIDFAGSTGLLYPLDGLRLEPGGLIGTSNAATTGPFAIVPERKDVPWLLIVPRRYLDALIDQLIREK
jgi:thiamine pyrophosphokinase